MRCNAGDLAVVVRSFAGNEGAIVRVMRTATDAELNANDFTLEYLPVWVIDAAVMSNWGSPISLMPDEFLRPLRDTDGEDEILRVAGKPKKDLLQECDKLIQQFNAIAEDAKRIQR